MKKILYKLSNNKVSIGIPGLNFKRLANETDNELLTRVAEKDKPENCISYRFIDDSKFPVDSEGNIDRTFRNVWKDTSSTTMIDVDMPKARIIWMDRIRKERDKSLIVLDRDELKFMSQNNAAELQKVRDEKQVLRDIPQNTDLRLASTPNTLKAIWPTEIS